MSFKINVDMSDAKARSLQAKKGLLRARKIGARLMDKRNDFTGCSSALITWEVVSGPQAGAQFGTFHSLPDSDHMDPDKRDKANAKAKSDWVSVLLSTGMTLEEVRSKKGVDSDHLDDLIVHVDYTPRDQEGKVKASSTWLTPSQFELRESSQALHASTERPAEFPGDMGDVPF